jgi:hypothetical protein
MNMIDFFTKVYCALPKRRQKTIKIIYRSISTQLRLFAVRPLLHLDKFSLKDKIQDINRFEHKIYSQNGEDGITQAIFSKIGTTNKFCVEFGVEDGRECNTRYLIDHQGWRFLHMDGANNPPSTIRKEYITAENINALFKKYHVPKEFDLLSLDIDYNTYWIWKAIQGYSPRAIIIEYNSFIPVNESKAVRYHPNATWDGTQYYGASLLALTKLGNTKGYTLIGCDKKGINAFFVRTDLAKKHFKISPIEELYRPYDYIRVENGVYVKTTPSRKKFVSV